MKSGGETPQRKETTSLHYPVVCKVDIPWKGPTSYTSRVVCADLFSRPQPTPQSSVSTTMSSKAGWDSVTGIATLLFDGNLVAIAIAIIFTFGVPITLHLIFFQAVASPPSSNFLLLGPSGAGKTAFTTLVV